MITYFPTLIYKCIHAQLASVIGAAYLSIGFLPAMSSNSDISILTYPIITILTIWFFMSRPYYDTDN